MASKSLSASKAYDTGIYSITCAANGRHYIGSAVSIKKRWREHQRTLDTKKHHSRFMQRAWNKYGDAAFRFKVVLICDKKDLLMYEQIMIDNYKPEYNSSPTAGSQLGYRHTDESRKKMSASRSKTFSPMTGKKHTEETKRKVSATKKGTKYGAYSRERALHTAAEMRKAKNAITESEVLLIRKKYNNGEKATKIAKDIGRGFHSVYDVIRNRTFKWVV